MNIANIHAMRDSFASFRLACEIASVQIHYGSSYSREDSQSRVAEVCSEPRPRGAVDARLLSPIIRVEATGSSP
jgi:hypothetical protein